MNIFVLSDNPIDAAKYHCDKHVIKMIVESTQLLSNAHHYYNDINYIDDNYYINELEICKPTHINHPCSKWVRETSGNYKWLLELLYNLLEEYQIRYGDNKNKWHKSWNKFDALISLPNDIPIKERTKFVLCMPDEYKCNCPVESYRRYYINEKLKFAKYNYSEIPYWLKEYIDF